MSKKKRHNERTIPVRNKNKPNNKPSIPSGNNAINVKPKWQHILLIIFLTTIIYSNTLKNEFVYDDNVVIVENNLIKSFNNIPLFFSKPIISSTQRLNKGYRPLVMVSFVLNYALCGLDVVGYHIVNILLHLANALLVYGLVLTIFGFSNDVNNRYMIALFTSLIFVTHPINTEAVNYIWQRSELMASCFYLLSVISFLKYQLLRKKNIFIFSIVFFIMALLSKEIAVTIPLIMLLLDWYLISNFNKDKYISNLKKYHSWFMLILFIYILFRVFNGAASEFTSSSKALPFNYLITQFGVITKYLGLLFFPRGLAIHHEVPVLKSVLSIPVLLSLGVIVLIIYTAIRKRKEYKILSFFALWFFIILLPTSSILPLQIIMNEHRVYLSGIGFITMFVILLCRYVSHEKYKHIPKIILLIFIFMLSMVTFNRNSDWKDGLTLWSKNLSIYPESVKALNNRGRIYRNKGMHEKAIADYSKSIELSPKNAIAYRNRGAVYDEAGYHKEVLADFNRAIEIYPYSASAYYNRGTYYSAKGFYRKAMADFTKAIEIYPKYSQAYNNRGVAYWKKGYIDKAIADYNKAIELNSEYSEAYNNRGMVYNKNRNIDKAIIDFNRAIELDPKYIQAYNNRGLVYWKKRLYNKSISDYNKAIELDPENVKAYNNRAITYWKQKLYNKAIADFTKVIELDREHIQAYGNRSHAYKLMGKPDLAKQDEEKAQSLMKRE